MLASPFPQAAARPPLQSTWATLAIPPPIWILPKFSPCSFWSSPKAPGAKASQGGPPGTIQGNSRNGRAIKGGAQGSVNHVFIHDKTEAMLIKFAKG